MKILVTGSEGFIGQHVVNKLLTLGHEVAGVDCFEGQVHGGPNFPKRDYEYHVDYAGTACWDFHGADVVIHLGAKVGVGQSMYEIDSYVFCNTNDTAQMLQKLSRFPPKRLVVASSMSIYGEGYAAHIEDY